MSPIAFGHPAAEFDPSDDRVEIVGGGATALLEIMEIDLGPITGVAGS